MSQKLKAAVIGAGIMGTRHSHTLHVRPEVELVAISDLRREAAEELAQKEGAKSYQDYQEMLSKEDLDIVVVATPDTLHREPVVACAKAGVRNIIVEKPLATTVADATQMVQAARDAGVRLLMMFHSRASAMDMACRYAMRAGLLGEVVYGDITVDDNIGVPTQMWGTRSQEWASMSSSAHFLLSHVADRIRWYFSPAEVESIYAISQHKVLRSSPDLYDAFVHMDNGLKLRMKAGWIDVVEGVAESAMRFNGDKGQLIHNRTAKFGVQPGWTVNFREEIPVDELRTHQEELLAKGFSTRIITRRLKPEVGDLAFPMALEIVPRDLPNRSILDFLVDGILEDTLTPASWRAWQGDAPLPTGDDGLLQTQIVCAIVDSAEQRAEVKVPVMQGNSV